MNGPGLWMVVGAALVALGARPALAQTEPEMQGARPPSAYPLHPRERHVYVRAEFSTGARLRDPFGQGTLAPPSVLVQGSFGFVHLGNWLLAPSLGVQVGIASPFTQIGIQPGVTIHRRLSRRLGVHARLDVPLFLTQGASDPAGFAPVPQTPAFANEMGMGVTSRVYNVPAPNTAYNTTLAPGLEVAAGASFYLRAGLALTAEVIINGYLGDSQYIYPIVGGGLGVLVDYELLP